jgi:hypothetical protein
MPKLKAIPYDGDMEELEQRRPVDLDPVRSYEDQGMSAIKGRTSPFDKSSGDGGPNQELSFILFPTQTYQRVSDEATKRGLSFAEATAEAFQDWMTKEPTTAPYPGTGLPGMATPSQPEPEIAKKGRYIIGGRKQHGS